MISRVEYLMLKARVDEESNNLKRLETSLKKLKLFPEIKTQTINEWPLDHEIS
ncbi:MAG: hypothetical protein ACOX4Q_11830 [Syntrophomonadales bacterium]